MFKNIVPYSTCIYIYTPISMWSGFMWIHGKLDVPDTQYIDREKITNVIIAK